MGNSQDTAHAWWSRLRHQGLLLSPVVMLERFPNAPEPAPFHKMARLRDAYNRFVSTAEARQGEVELNQAGILSWVDSLLEHYIGHEQKRLARKQNIPDKLTAVLRIGTRSDTIKPHRVVFADAEGTVPALLVMADTSHIVGRGRGQTPYSRFLELLRGTGHRLGLLTNGHQFRLIYAGLDFESWCEWESDRWFDDGDGTEELNGLRQLLSPDALKPVKEGTSGLLDAVEESRKRQADLSSVLRENVRQAVELLLDEVSTTNRTEKNLFASLVAASSERPLTDAEAHESLLQATVRVVMRLVVCLFAESRGLLPGNEHSPIYAQSYGVRSLYELLEETTRNEGGIHGLLNRNMAWPRLMSLFRLIYGGSAHGAFPMRAYGGVLFRPGNNKSGEPVAHALHILEHGVSVCDATIYAVLRKLLRGPLPVIKGRSKTFVEGPVDYTDLRTEFIGLIYEGILDYRLKRTDEKIGPQVFLNLGREPVLPLARLEDMLANDKKALKDLLVTLRKEKVTSSADAEEEENEDKEAEEAKVTSSADAEEEENEDKEAEEADDTEETSPVEEAVVEAETSAQQEGRRAADFLDAVESAKCWAREAVKLAGLVRKQGKKESDSQYQQEVEAEATRLINRVVATGEFYLVRAGNTRKGTGTFYTRPQLAVPTVHRTLEPLCYDKAVDGTLVPKEPEAILGLKVCDSSCGSASFLVAALHYMTDALYMSLCHHRKLDDPEHAKKLTLPYGRPRTAKTEEDLVPFPPNDPHRGDTFADRIKALLRRHVVERCIYGVDINPLAVEFARVSLWVETLDPELPFSFLDHKIKVGNSLVGCWLDRVLDYPLKAWEREGGDGKDGPRTQAIETFLKGEKKDGRRSGDGRIKKEMRAVIESQFRGQASMFEDQAVTTDKVVASARSEYECLHNLPIHDTDEREQYYREHVEGSAALQQLKRGMDEWCAVWFWPTNAAPMALVPTPQTFHQTSADRAAIVQNLTAEMKFFHWELAFPDVFTSQRSGFDANLGNPPWDVMKSNSQEFFTDFDPLYRTYDKQTALRKQKEFFISMPGVAEQWDGYNARFKALANWVRSAADPFDQVLARGNEGTGLAAVWAKHRQGRVGYADAEHPFRLQGSADLNSYKMFLELAYSILGVAGRLGMIVPSGLYTDYGTRAFRILLLNVCTWEWLFSFQNRKQIFPIHTDTKFAVIVAGRGKKSVPLMSAFLIHDMTAWERPNAIAFEFDHSFIPVLSPDSWAIPEIQRSADLMICKKLYNGCTTWRDSNSVWNINSGREFHMVDDSKSFPRIESWEAKGFKKDEFGRWFGENRSLALPFYQGAMIHQFDPCFQAFISGAGKGVSYQQLPHERKDFAPQFLMAADVAKKKTKGRLKIAFRAIGNPKNQRSMLNSIVTEVPCGHMLPLIHINHGDLFSTCCFSAILNSFIFDYLLRMKMGSPAIGFFILQEMPIPTLTQRSTTFSRLALACGELTFLHRRFAPEWLRLKHLYHELAAKEWKHWWAVTEANRLRLRVEIDALCADLYGLEPDDFDWIVRDDPTDPKGFYRVDRKLPFRERLTGLAAAAFRALQEGKWSAETAAKLSNDEFFEIIGIPELTSPAAAKAINLTEPLILKRDGCHEWEPEKFLPTDPRFGWTWKDCWNDAVALLGSEEAVKEYVEGKKKQVEEEAQPDGPADLFGNPLPPKQGKLF